MHSSGSIYEYDSDHNIEHEFEGISDASTQRLYERLIAILDGADGLPARVEALGAEVRKSSATTQGALDAAALPGRLQRRDPGDD